MAAVPKGVQGIGIALVIPTHQFFGDDGKSTAGAGKAGGFGEGAELNGAVPRPFNLKNAMGNILFGDKAFVCSIKK